MRTYLRSKIHKARVTAADLNYIGSITIDVELMEKADMAEWEKVLVVDNTNGNRLETYVIPGDRGSGTIQMNGAAAHLIRTGDEVIVMTFQTTDHPVKPRQILVDPKNRYVRDI
ncbi:MAG: aspartate 1-decarboxylase [Planctomycetota bacterium]|nr:aspartate 1-decarboxylase [Planctomycetota bacterium]